MILWANTDKEPIFLDRDFQQMHRDEAEQLHEEFVQSLRVFHPDLNQRYVAMFPDGRYQVPYDVVGYNLLGEFKEGKVKIDGRSITVDQLLIRFIEDTAGIPTIGKVDTIVEFSPEPIYPEVLAVLERIYDIKKINV